ncbi:hypothetical protein [Bradyrhizobium sp. F1.13.3]
MFHPTQSLGRRLAEIWPVEIDSYDEVPELLPELERRVAQRPVWVSGS